MKLCPAMRIHRTSLSQDRCEDSLFRGGGCRRKTHIRGSKLYNMSRAPGAHRPSASGAREANRGT